VADRGQFAALEQPMDVQVGLNGLSSVACCENRNGRIVMRQASASLRKPRLIVSDRAGAFIAFASERFGRATFGPLPSDLLDCGVPSFLPGTFSIPASSPRLDR